MQPNREFWSDRAVCVLGGTGFLGYHLVRQLRDRGARVRILGLPPSENHPLRNEPGFDLRYGDILHPDKVRDAVAAQSVVFNLAGVVSATAKDPKKFHEIHLHAIRNAIAAADPAARIVHTSSVTVIGASRRPEVLNEDSPFTLERVRIDYVHAKRAAEKEALAAASSRDVVVVNPGYLIGPDDPDLSIMGWFCDRFWRGKVPFVGPGGLNLVDVRDVATGHMLAAERGQTGRRYVLGGENRTQQELLHLLAEAAGWRPRRLPRVPGWFLYSIAGIEELLGKLGRKRPFPSFADARVGLYYWYYSSERAAKELGFTARPLQETLADTFAWHQTHGLPTLHGWRRRWFRPPATELLGRVGRGA